jgi:serine/threonine-protein kinase HipA
VGLRVPLVRRVQFSSDSELKSPGLLIERFDLPISLVSPREVPVLEEAAVLLGVPREDKYNVSLERVASALLAAGLSPDHMDQFADHIIFSWIVGNGDLHAKNIGVLRSIEPGLLGNPPRLMRTSYSPLYDLVNTRLVIRGDLFALPVNGKQNNLRVNDFAVLTRLWGRTRQETRARVESLDSRITADLPAVLAVSQLSENLREIYERTVESAIDSL